MKFRTAYSGPEHIVSPSGSRFRHNYVKSYTSDGSSELIEAGVEDVYDSIQKAAPGNVIEDLIARAQRGDSSAIPPAVDSYVDVSDMPSDILGMHEKLQRCRSEYDALPSAVRSQFNNNYNDFLRAIGDGSIVQKLSQLHSDESSGVTPLSADEIQKIRSTIGGSNA